MWQTFRHFRVLNSAWASLARLHAFTSSARRLMVYGGVLFYRTFSFPLRGGELHSSPPGDPEQTKVVPGPSHKALRKKEQRQKHKHTCQTILTAVQSSRFFHLQILFFTLVVFYSLIVLFSCGYRATAAAVLCVMWMCVAGMLPLSGRAARHVPRCG